MFTKKVSSLGNPLDPKPKTALTSFVSTGLSISKPATSKAPGYKIVDVYAAYDEDMDGRKKNVLGYFTAYTKAVGAARGQGAWGGNGQVETKRAIVIGGKYFILEHESPVMNKTLNDIVKANALNKLTVAEKRALGLA